MTGNQLDLNHLWTQVQELSAILQANREQAQGLIRRADEIRVNLLSPPLPNTENRPRWKGDWRSFFFLLFFQSFSLP